MFGGKEEYCKYISGVRTFFDSAESATKRTSFFFHRKWPYLQPSLDSMEARNINEPPSWDRLADLLRSGANMDAVGAAKAHTVSARTEAATKLIGNHKRVLMDLTNPSMSLTYDGLRKLTQTTLQRLPPVMVHQVDCCLREVCRRLLGCKQGVSDLEEVLVASTPVEAMVWMGVWRYLHDRIQSSPEQKPGRTPDMSEEAAAAMKAILAELGAPGSNTEVGPDLRWKWK